MRKAVLTLALVAVAALGNAQVLKNNFMNGCQKGEAIEKGTYASKKAPFNADMWSRPLNEKAPITGESAVAGEELTYKGYDEKGPSIVMRDYIDENGVRPTLYGLDGKTTYKTGSYYLSFLVNFSKFKANARYGFIATSPDFRMGGSRGYVTGAPKGNQVQFGVGLAKARKAAPQAYDLDKTHLIVLKVDYDNNKASIFINPELKDKEPAPDAEVTEEGALKGSIKAIMLKEQKGIAGNIGNFRFADSWAGVIGK